MDLTLKPSAIADAVEICLHASQPVCLWGSPGIGKSQIIAQTARKLGVSLIDLRVVLLDPVDLRGLPTIASDGRTRWAVPEFLPRDGNGILFLDEINRGAQMVQNACLQLVLDRKLGEYTLPDGWNIVSACNRETDGGGVSRMSSALSSRFAHLTVEPDLNDWCKWAVQAGIDPMVIAFLRFRPELLASFDKNVKAFPCPRTWEFVSKIASKRPVSQELELNLVAGTVGHSAAIEYMSFVKLYRSLPSLDAILLNPTQATVPSDVATLYAVSAGLARRADAGNFTRVLQYVSRLPEEFGVMAVKDAVTRDATLQATQEFTLWAVKHSDVVF